MRGESLSKMPEFFPEGDAHTLANAHAIHANPKRHKAAREAAGRLAKTSKDKAAGMQMVVDGTPPGSKEMNKVFEKHWGPKGKVTKAMRR